MRTTYKNRYCKWTKRIFEVAHFKIIRALAALILVLAAIVLCIAWGIVQVFIKAGPAIKNLCADAYEEIRNFFYDAWHWDELPENRPTIGGLPIVDAKGWKTHFCGQEVNHGQGKEKAD